MQVQPYLFFDGRCEEALEFYKKALGAEVTMLMRYKDAPPSEPGAQPHVSPDKIMHASMRIGDTVVNASDGHCTGQPSFKGFANSLVTDSGPQAEKFFAALSDGGKVQLPMTKTFFSSHFGMLEDRFGVGWMVLVMS
jgi:PhnB protein